MRINAFRQFVAGFQAHLSLRCHQHAVFRQRLHTGVLGAGEDVRIAELDVVERILAEQLHAEAAFAVEFAFLLVIEGVQLLVDDLQCSAHAHGLAVGFQHALVAAEHANAGADGGLRQVHRGNVGGLQLFQRRAHFPVEGIDELAAGGAARGFVALAANEDDAGCEGIRAAGN